MTCAVFLSVTFMIVVIGAISSLNLPAERGLGALLRPRAVLVLHVARDLVALGDLLGRLQHRPVDFGLVLDEPRILEMQLVSVVLHERDRFDSAGDENVVLAGR